MVLCHSHTLQSHIDLELYDPYCFHVDDSRYGAVGGIYGSDDTIGFSDTAGVSCPRLV